MESTVSEIIKKINEFVRDTGLVPTSLYLGDLEYRTILLTFDRKYFNPNEPTLITLLGLHVYRVLEQNHFSIGGYKKGV